MRLQNVDNNKNIEKNCIHFLGWCMRAFKIAAAAKQTADIISRYVY